VHNQEISCRVSTHIEVSSLIGFDIANSARWQISSSLRAAWPKTVQKYAPFELKAKRRRRYYRCDLRPSRFSSQAWDFCRSLNALFWQS
jgi:hypothetical protein